MATNTTQNKGAILARAHALAAGTAKELGANATLVIAGASMTVEEIHAKLQAVEELFRALQGARLAVSLALAACNKALPGLKLFMANYEAAVKGQFGVNSPKLCAFGIKAPRKARRRTSTEKLIAAARGQQTRLRRRLEAADQGAAAGAAAQSPTTNGSTRPQE